MDLENLDEKEGMNIPRCLYQIIKMALPYELRKGSGNCNKCAYNPKENKKCRGYHPAKIACISVKD